MEEQANAWMMQLWPLVVVVAVVWWFHARGRGRAAAGADAVAGLAEGLHRFAGCTEGIPWTAEVSLLRSEVDDGLSARTALTTAFTVWTAAGSGTGGGALLLVNLPEGGASPVAIDAGEGLGTGDGMLAGLADKAGAIALNLYVRQRFGGDRAEAARLAPSQRRWLEGDPAWSAAYLAWSSRADLWPRLSAAARDLLLEAHSSGVSLLWDEQGLSLHWPTARAGEPAMADSAGLGARLALALAPEALR